MSENRDISPDDKSWFATTHWSVVLAGRDPSSPQGQEALEALCRTYWRPLYVYAFRKTHSKEDAEDLTQGFFAKLLEKKLLDSADRERGRFRTFLLTALKHFMFDERDRVRAQKRGGGATFISIDDPQLKEMMDVSAAPNVNPEHGYDRGWAMTILSEPRRLLQAEYAATGRADDFQALAPCVFLGESKVSYPELSTRLNKSEGAVRQEVSRLKKRHRELVRQAVANTVANARDVDDELRYLFETVNQQ